MEGKDEIRQAVARAYREAVKDVGGCCGEGVPKCVVAQFAGYAPDELASLPPDAVANSFGCGNPVVLGQLREGEVVLDLGSGAGIDLLLAAARVGTAGRVIGVDMTGEMIERAQANVSAAGLTNVEVRCGIIEDLPVDSESVDVVISNCVINLSPEKDRVFEEIARVLKPGGRLVVSDVVVEDLPGWVRVSEALWGSCIAGAISETDYFEGLRRAGLERVVVEERLTYDEEQVRAFLASHGEDAGRCCGGPVGADEGDLVALVGKVKSALISARKPEPPQ